MFYSSALGSLALKVRHGWHLSICSLACAAMQGQKKWSCSKSSICLRPNGQLHCGILSGKSLYVWLVGPVGIGPLGILWVALGGSSYTEFELVVFKKELSEFSQFKLMLTQSSVLLSCNHKTQDWI